MSKFFVVTRTSTSDFKESDSETESEVSEEERLPSSKPKTFSFSDDEEELKRTVRSAKVKRFEEIQSVVKSLKNSRKIKDVGKVLEEFDALTKVYAKSQKVIEKEGIPAFFTRSLVDLEDFVALCWAEKASLSKQNVKSLGCLRSKLRKYVKDFETAIADFRENPVASEEENNLEEEESEEESGSDEEVSEEDLKPKKPTKVVKPIKAEDLGDESDSDWDDSGSDDVTSESDDEDKYRNDPAARFLKRDAGDEKKEKKKEKIQKPRTTHRKVPVIDEDGFVRMVDKPRLFTKETDITHEVVLKKLGEILALRGKKSTDRQEQIELIEELRTVSRRANLGYAIEIKLMMSLISSVFDYNPNVASNMKPEMWKRLLDAITEFLKLLIEHTEIVVGEHISEDDENFTDPNNMRVAGLPLSLVERMDDEFTKILQNCDAHSPEYLENLKNEVRVCQLIERMQYYLEATDAAPSELCHVYERRIAHIYYKVDNKFMEAAKKGIALIELTSLDTMDRLCTYIYNHDDTDRIRLRAILMRVYHLALHDQWYAARDLMLMSKAQETIHLSDPPTQVLYNRAMVQLGISAFRQGNISEAHNALMDIQSSGRPKELLAQGLLPVRQHERSAEQEKIEKRRQIPFHMHINLDVLECVYLVSAMFIEVPYLAAHENDQRRRIISKYFYHSMKQSERHALSGPPETLPEYVIAASKSMKTGDWKKCREFVLSEKLNRRVWDFFHEPEKIRQLLGRRVQECSLRCFMFTNSAFYDAISVQTLSEMFELDKDEILGLVGKMIVTEDLAASVDEPSQTVIMHRTEPSRVQQLSLQLADKLTSFVESNERMLEMKNPGFQRPQNKQWVDRRQHGGGQYQQRQEHREVY